MNVATLPPRDVVTDADRIDRAVSRLLMQDHRRVVRTLIDLRVATRAVPPLELALCCFVIADLALRQVPDVTISDDAIVRLHSLAADTAERMAPPG